MDDEPDLTADERYPHRVRDAELVEAARGTSTGGEGNQAFGRLYDLWFDRVYAVALRIVGQPEVAVEVAQDAFLSAWRNLASLDDPRAFGGWLLRIARNAALNRHEREQRSHPVDDGGLTMIEATGASPSNAPAGFGAVGAGLDPSAAVERDEMQELVWSAVAALPDRDAEVLDLQLRHGMSPAEIGDIIGVNRNAANQLVHRVRARFETAVRARVLWRGDRPECDDLAALLAAAGIDRFGADAVKLTERHASSCDRCAEKRELRLRPAALFASVPVVAAPIAFKQQVAAAMEAAGVPMQGSTFASSGPAASGTAEGDGGGSPEGRGPSDGQGGGNLAAMSNRSPGRSVGRSTRRRRIAAMAAVVAAVLLAAVVLFAVETHDPPVPEVAESAESAETTVGGSLSASSDPSTTTVAPTSSAVTIPDQIVVTTSSTVPSSSSTTSTPPSSVSMDVRLTPGSVTVDPQRSFAPPVLSWSVTGTGGYSVRVDGPSQDGNGTVPSTAASGGGRVCPGTIAQGRCYYRSARPATFDYVITVLGPDGQVLATRTLTLAIV